jgi:hypothetical protein
MYKLLIRILLLARLIMASRVALNTSGEVSRDISSPLAPKHGCDDVRAVDSASNGASLCGGIGLGGVAPWCLLSDEFHRNRPRGIAARHCSASRTAGKRDGPAVACGHDLSDAMRGDALRIVHAPPMDRGLEGRDVSRLDFWQY